jgi:hypothetical protein
MHTGGLRGLAKSTWFSLKSPAGVVCIVLVDSVRMDLSHQTVLLRGSPSSPSQRWLRLPGAIVGLVVRQARSNIRQRRPVSVLEASPADLRWKLSVVGPQRYMANLHRTWQTLRLQLWKRRLFRDVPGQPSAI